MNSSPQDGFPKQRAVGFPRSVIDHALKHPLLRALVPTGMGMFPRAHGQRFECQDGIEEAVLIFCAKGRGWCEIGQRRHGIGPGELLVIPPGVPHACGADSSDPWTIPWVHVTGENVKLLLAELGASIEMPIVKVGDDPQVLALFENAVTLAEAEGTYTTTRMFHTSQTVSHLLALINWRRRQGTGKPPEVKERIAQAVEFMKHNLSEALQLDRVAAVANLSPSQFGLLFRKETGFPPMEYLVQLRMERARHLLEATDLSMKEIAAEVGYKNPAYFCQSFRNTFEMPPSEYREKRGQQ
jgi:AraC family transcriptional regulator, arabinose operon regulatory protein